MADEGALTWVILTQGDRPGELRQAVESVGRDPVVIVWNGVEPLDVPGARAIATDTNRGVPGGRAVGVEATSSPLIGFLDDDARLLDDLDAAIEAFDDPTVAVVCCRLADEVGHTSRRHVPRPGSRGADEAGPVVTFLGGASIIRRSAYDQVGGYCTDLFYSHEELDLAWRLIDAGWSVRYVPATTVFHPRTEISRHAGGWCLTGRNRVMVARRNLPWVVAIVHCVVWLGAGLLRAPGWATKRSYLVGWTRGWFAPVGRRPIRWRTVWRLTRLGRPPII